MTTVPANQCPACGGPAGDGFAVHYRFPRPVLAPQAPDPRHVYGIAHLRTCDSVACKAGEMLGAVTRAAIIAALIQGHLVVRPEDIEILQVALPGEPIAFGVVPHEKKGLHDDDHH